MLRFQEAKKEAQRVLHSWLQNPGTVNDAVRPEDAYPASSFFVLWPLTPEARGDGSTVVPYHRQFLSGICYSRGDVWIPLVMLERIIMSAILVLQSTLEDMRKLSPELYLPEILPDSHMTSWWEDLCGWKNTPVHRTFVAFGRPTTVDVGPFPELLMDLEPEFVKIREALDEEEDAHLNRKADGTVLDRTGIAQHRSFYRPDSRVAAKGGKRGKGPTYREVIPVIKNPHRTDSKGTHAGHVSLRRRTDAWPQSENTARWTYEGRVPATSDRLTSNASLD